MFNRKKVLLVDGNNIAHRSFWAMRGRVSHNGANTEVVFGFTKQLMSLRRKFPNHSIIIAWDGGKDRRKKEAMKAVEAGIIPSGYKANREKRDGDDKETMEDLFFQMDEFREVAKRMGVFQIKLKGYEADDIIYTYSRKKGRKSIIVSSDTDFYQCIDDETSVFDPKDKELWTADRFQREMGFPASRWVDVISLVGKKADNVFGVDLWGKVTAVSHIREHGSIDEIIDFVEAKKSGGKKLLKREENLLNQLDRLRLAQSLQSMDRIKGLPKPVPSKKASRKKLVKMLDRRGCQSLIRDVNLLS